VTDAQAWAVIRGSSGFPSKYGQYMWFCEQDIMRLEVVDDVLTIEMSLASGSTEYIDEDLAKLFDVPRERVDAHIDHGGCDSCGYGTGATFTINLKGGPQ
jgi:hypothetical protein